MTFDDSVRGLLNGDFSRLEPQFRADIEGRAAIVQWHAAGRFASHAEALAEAFTCACFLGADDVVDYLLAQLASPDGGKGTGLNAFHWAVNRGQLRVVDKLIRAGASLEELNRFGGSVLSCAVWSLLNEPRPDHFEILRTLLAAGARVDALPQTTGDARVDELLDRYRTGSKR